MCEQIAKVRRKIQRTSIQHILFLDETYSREGDVDNYTIVLPGEPSIIHTSTTSSYAPRFDMIACVSGTRVLPPHIYAPNERGAGITQHMLLQYIRNLLAQAAGALDVYPLTLYLDRSPIHDEGKMLQEFHDWGCQDLVEIVKLPPSSAKRLSPLDNALFHVWKQRVVDSGPLTKNNIKQRMTTTWESFTAEQIKQQYHKCGLLRGQDPYFDCPFPAQHKHKRK